MDPFTAAYVRAALWSSLDEDDKPIEDRFDSDNLAPKFQAEVERDCEAFQREHVELLRAAYRTSPSYDAAQAGHDFWLTRNRHGAGFWDRGMGHVGGALTDAAHAYGSVDLYVDGLHVDSL